MGAALSGRGKSSDGGATENPAGPSRIQSLGRQPDAGRLCAALHRQERAALVDAARRADRHRRHLLPGAGGDRRVDHALLRRHQHHRRHHRRRHPPVPHRPAGGALRLALRRRHRPAHPRRRLRLYRLDHHLADLRHLHLHPLRHRSLDHVDGARAVLRHSAAHRLRHQRRRGDPAGHPRHDAHQPLPAHHPAPVDRPQHPAGRLHRLAGLGKLRDLAQLPRPRRRRRRLRPVEVRRRGLASSWR